MRMKWLKNLELLLLEHISVYYQERSRIDNRLNSTHLAKYRSYDDLSSYHIDSSFISIVIRNFLKIFIIRNINYHHDEFSFFQHGLTSHLRYLLIELPTYNHKNENDDNNEENCFQCDQYSLILKILFDLLFDLIEYDLCEIHNKEKYRSSLIEEDYFNQFIQRKTIKKNKFYRIKLIIYFIELISLHRNKCKNIKEYFHIDEKRIFQSIENFLQHIIDQLNR